RPNQKRVVVLVENSDKGLVGAYNANVLRATEELLALLREQGKDPQLYVIGTKGVNYYRFRDREIAGSWTGFSQQPRYENAAEVGATLVDAFVAGADDDGASAGADGVLGVDELHIVYTEFRSMLTQTPEIGRASCRERVEISVVAA